MNTLSRRILIGALSLILLNSACGPYSLRKPTPVGTIVPGVQFPTTVPAGSFTATAGAGAAATSTTLTPLIPITGENVVAMQCQFCVDSTAHTVLIFPEFALFDVLTTTPATCLTAQVVNGRRVLICRGEQLSTFNLNVCSDPSNCLQFQVAFGACPLVPATGAGTPVVTFTPVTPYFITPINTLLPPATPPFQPTQGPTLAPTQTIVVPPPSTPTPGLPPTQPPVPTDTPAPPPTEPPPPTGAPPTIAPTDPPPTDPPPEPTDEPKPTKKPSKTPKPKP